jgi:ACT domain-containing protein
MNNIELRDRILPKLINQVIKLEMLLTTEQLENISREVKQVKEAAQTDYEKRRDWDDWLKKLEKDPNLYSVFSILNFTSEPKASRISRPNFGI